MDSKCKEIKQVKLRVRTMVKSFPAILSISFYLPVVNGIPLLADYVPKLIC